MAVELALKARAEVTALASSAVAAERLLQMGAVVVSSVSDAEGSFNVVLESVGGALMSEAIRKLARQGVVLWFGEASGQPVTLDFFCLFDGHET